MDEKVLKIIIILLIYIGISIIMDFKIKNLISEKYNIVLTIFMNLILFSVMWFSNGLIDEMYNLYAMLLILSAIMITYATLKKNKVYSFKGIDKDFVKENKTDILNIIYEYKNNDLDNELEASVESNRLIFNKANKYQIKECLLLVGNYLNENRKKYTIKDYLNYYAKTMIVPFVIVIALLLTFNKIRNYDSLLDIEQISIQNEYIVGNIQGNINNYGLVAETPNFIYYVNGFQLCRLDKDLKNEVVLVKNPENCGKDTLNMVEDWIFYRQGKEIIRAKADGTNIETIFKGYSLHM